MHGPLNVKLSPLSNVYYVLPRDGLFRPKNVVKSLPYINLKNPLVMTDGLFLYVCW